ncbi:MAG: gamma-glutamylcyclotransferase [Balneolales bacterium]|nr:gamma-glutamylcyclotransferase [Balneolales bacterium]
MSDSHIFVYGLLKSMYTNEPALKVRAHCSLIGEGWFPGLLIDIGTYPGSVYDSESDSFVYGEVFKVEHGLEELTAYLDAFEGVGPQFDFPNEYKREIIPVHTEQGELKASCYLYNWPWDGKAIIESGRYENASGTRGK